MSGAMPFAVVVGGVIERLLAQQQQPVMDLIARAYQLHGQGESINPDSYFLRFAQKPDARIIALPAYLGGEVDTAGLKWIASFPGNVQQNLQRASAVLILNDYATGYPKALLESSVISAHRTAASAALGARALSGGSDRVRKIAIVGAGVIARQTLDYLFADGWSADEFAIHDLREQDARRLGDWIGAQGKGKTRVASDAEDCCAGAQLIVLATTAAAPYLTCHELFAHAPTVLNLSLRDIHPDLILDAQNVLDDIDHCLKANTSVHLAEMQTGSRSFVAGTLHDVLSQRLAPDPARARIFSPFGLGVLDIALGDFVLKRARASGQQLEIDNFFASTARW
ncbi:MULTISPECIES: 2,3-diaminopropionate biosynthesis protein SbnB [Pseudomonas]|uniref:2,3-diaminopropionate biosynthesis protein SbnB n=1 Tax=Pseudomonas sessilinigenes TaxID=658629 RepID=A0ABX8MYB6_9PSED|nr:MULTISPECIES: 2,3-diaminopropionate biosynthesis protein SbnB [Pseudomonas]AZC24472.1 2,3-diaminopropionate for siderophore biosynthesis protein SbnB [Pseudomonas sessilinigenes]QXH43408.1 2,3-diaminopropionate biosynthesis protein SbnB [Pseudomonas sessilinigenes]UMZ14714.1 2,3-diaminopropionate biosynthesis protein SbnB [Pseudomonas sp. MPFS]